MFGKRLATWAADRIEILELYPICNTPPDLSHDFTKPVKRLGRLREEADIPAKIQPAKVLYLLDNDGRPFRLPDQTIYFGMPFLSIDHDLRMTIRA